MIGGFGIGGFVFTLLSERMINPDEIEPEKGAEKPFDPEVANNLPGTMQVLTFCFIGLLALSIIFVQPFVPRAQCDEDDMEI